MAFGVDQLEALAECVELINSGRRTSGGARGAGSAGGRDERLAGLDDVVAFGRRTGAVPQIVSHDGRPPHIHVTRATAALADRIAAHSAMGLAELVVAGAAGRVRTCASPRCDAVFIDMSRNQSRRFCDSRTCGNRVHVAAYRSRRSASPVGPAGPASA